MSEAKTLNDLLKSLPTATDPSGKSVLLSDVQGELSKITRTGLIPVSLKKSNSGAGICQGQGLWLVAAVSESDYRKYAVGIYLKRDYLANPTSGVWIQLASSTITAEGWNTMGTIAATGADDIVFLAVRFDIS